ncbi:MAG: hypothetical protein ACQEXX_01730 [Bacillota bacterium]
MGLNLNGWDMEDINMKMRDKTLFEIISIYQQQETLLIAKSLEYLQAVKDKNETAKERIHNECDQLDKEKCVVAIRIADTLSKVSK